MWTSRITITSETRPCKRAQLRWRGWWFGGGVVLLLEEQAEKGWTVRHRTTMRGTDWGRGFAIAKTWLCIDPRGAVTFSGETGDITLNGANAHADQIPE